MEDAKKAKRVQTAGGERSNAGDTAHNETLAEGSDEKTPGGSGVKSPGISTHRPAKKTKRSVADADVILPVDGNFRDPDDTDPAKVRVVCEPFAGLPTRYIPSLQTADEQLN
ncbi:hypothetical protein PInf_007055 [Phytophthora infestans]|nr:hypothetical protein PInf_007055 [Phytophthora infestans]